MLITKDLQQELKRALARATKCEIQHDGWTCGTCFFSLKGKLTNKDWQAVLSVRGDYDSSELDNLPKDITCTIKKIIKIANNS